LAVNVTFGIKKKVEEKRSTVERRGEERSMSYCTTHTKGKERFNAVLKSGV